MPPRGQSFSILQLLLAPQLRASAPALTRPVQSRRPVGGWPCEDPLLFLFEMPAFLPLAGSCVPCKKRAHSHHFPGPFSPASPDFYSDQAEGGRQDPMVPSPPSPWGGDFCTLFCSWSIAAPWKGVFVPGGERYGPSGKDKRVARTDTTSRVKNTTQALRPPSPFAGTWWHKSVSLSRDGNREVSSIHVSVFTQIRVSSVPLGSATVREPLWHFSNKCDFSS